MEYEEDIETMIRINSIFLDSPLLLNDPIKKEKYNQIKHLVYQYLLEYCNHTIIEDCIDIDAEKSVHIKYCETCSITIKK